MLRRNRKPFVDQPLRITRAEVATLRLIEVFDAGRVADFQQAFRKVVQIEILLIGENEFPVAVDQPDATRHVVQRGPELGFLLGDFLLGPFALGNVDGDFDEATARYRRRFDLKYLLVADPPFPTIQAMV